MIDLAALKAAAEKVLPASTYPIRQKAAYLPLPTTSIERYCLGCGASFIGLAPGKTGERGLWDNFWKWYCSQECFDGAH